MSRLLRAVSSLAFAGLIGCQAPPTESSATGSLIGGPAVILNGNFPDPAILRDGDDYYMTHSHKDMAPGLLIWHSKDLYNWKRLTRALPNAVGSIAAPDFIKHGDKFYIYYPAGGTNWVITADRPEGPWSEPVDLEIRGIDPGHIATPDGRRFLHMNAGLGAELNADGLSLKTELEKVYDGWQYPEDYVVECFCLESPKLLFRNNFYYLTSAQGGTAGPSTSHMVVSARSDDPLGPWKNSPYNPIVRTRHRSEKWWSRGHGTILDDGSDNWYVVYHAYKNGYHNFGRLTLIEPVRWTEDGWFVATHPENEPFDPPLVHNHTISSDDFSGSELDLQWAVSGVSSLDDIQIGNGEVAIPAVPDRLRVLHTFAADHKYEAEIEFDVEGDAEAGLMLYYNQRMFAGIGVQSGQVFALLKGARSRLRPREIDAPGTRFLKLRLDEHHLALYYGRDGVTWQQHPVGVEVSAYQHNVVGDFASLKLGASTKGGGLLRVKNFQYRTLE